MSSRLPEQIIEIEAEEFKEEILKTDREMYLISHSGSRKSMTI